MSEINKEKRVVIQNDGQVVVYNDNARIDANGTTSRIEGYYLIDDDSVLKLCALQDDISYLRVNLFWINRTHFFSITKHDDFDAKIKEINEFLTRHLQSSEDSEKQIEELKDRVSALEYQIKKFNSTRHWWERKLKIKE
jgi:septal ring factor EnvC (AmiA/AmiB activator)